MRNYLLAASIVVLATSCGASKGALETENQQLQTQVAYQQQQLDQQQTQQTSARPNRTLRTTDPCEELSLEVSENLRAFGTATSYIEKTARNEAARDARNQLAQMIKIAVEGAAQDYSQNATVNLKKTAEEIGEVVMTQYVSEVIENTKPIKWSVFDLSDGSVQVSVCIEMEKSKKEVKAELSNVLDKDDVIGIQYDRDRFIDKIYDGLEEYKQQQREQ